MSTTIGLTGGIGSGKSAVSAMLAERGAVVLDADLLARSVVEPGGEAHEAVVARFGAAVTDAGGGIDRPALAQVVFADAGARADLEAIVHPAVGRAMVAALAEEAATDHVVVLDIPLLVESGGRSRYPLDGLLVVDAPEGVAVERLVRLRGMTEEAALARVAAQASRADRVRAADFVVLNIGTMEELRQMVDRAWEWVETLRAG